MTNLNALLKRREQLERELDAFKSQLDRAKDAKEEDYWTEAISNQAQMLAELDKSINKITHDNQVAAEAEARIEEKEAEADAKVTLAQAEEAAASEPKKKGFFRRTASKGGAIAGDLMSNLAARKYGGSVYNMSRGSQIAMGGIAAAGAVTSGVGKGVKAAGKATWGAAKGMGRGMAAGANTIGNGLLGVDKYLHGDAPKNVTALFWFAILFHLIDAVFLRFDRSQIGLSVALYSVLFIWSVFVFGWSEGKFDFKQVIFFIALAAFYLIVPSFLYKITPITIIGPTKLIDWVNLLLVVIPAWPIAIGMRAGIPFVHKYLNFWIVILLIVFIIGPGMKLRSSAIAAIGGRPEIVSAGPALNYIWDGVSNSLSSVMKSLNPNRWVPNLLNATGLNYYTGMVDSNEKEPVGLYIDKVRASDDYFYVGSPVIIWADLRGKSFNEPIIVSPACSVEGKISGVTDPSTISILGEEHDTVSCAIEGLNKGSYSVNMGFSFNFETWAYVTYTFVDLETKRAMEIQGKDINRELDIDRLPDAVYTNGPVMLGMGSMVDQPVGVDKTLNNREPVLGVTIDNLWTNGEVKKGGVHKFIIQIPDDFELTKCDRWPKDYKPAPVAADGMLTYEISPDLLGEVRQDFQSVTCRLHIKNPAELLGNAQKVQRTFVARAVYDYAITEKVRVTVRE